MAEKLRRIICPVCGDETDLLQDKRHKLYLNCSCGLQKFSTDKGQSILKSVPAVGEPSPKIDIGEKVEIPEDAPEPSGNRGGVLVLFAGVIMGGLSWLAMKRRA